MMSLKEKLKNILLNATIILIMIMIMMLCLSCNIQKKDTSLEQELPTIRVMVLSEGEASDMNRISLVISEITSQQIGCNIEFEVFRLNDYKEKIENLLKNKDMPDILISLNREMLLELTEGHYIYRIDKLLENHQGFEEQIEKKLEWSKIEVNGYSYGIPFNNDDVYYWGFLMRANVCDELGINPSSIADLTDLYKALTLAKNKYPNMIPIVPNYGDLTSFEEYDKLVNGIGCLAYKSSIYELLDEKIINIVNSEEFFDRCVLMNKWYQDGLILKNSSFDTAGRLEWLEAGNSLGSFAKISEYTQIDTAYTLEEDIYSVRLSGYRRDYSINTQSYCIYAYSMYDELCVEFLEMLYTDPKILELCMYGQEGIDYNSNANGYIDKIVQDGDTVNNFNSIWPNRKIARHINPPGGNLLIYEWKPEDISVSEGLGFQFNDYFVRNEVYQCNTVMDKYYYALISGLITPSDGIPMMLYELEKAGVKAVIHEKQRQFDLWLDEP